MAGDEIELVDESVPFDQAPDEDGELPDDVTYLGRPVSRGDGWWVYTDGDGRLVQFDDDRCWMVGPVDFEAAQRVLAEDGWDQHPDWHSILRRLGMALAEP